MSAESPFLATGIPSANTEREPLLTMALCGLQQHFFGHGAHGITCGISLSNILPILIPPTLTDRAVAMIGTTTSHL